MCRHPWCRQDADSHEPILVKYPPDHDRPLQGKQTCEDEPRCLVIRPPVALLQFHHDESEASKDRGRFDSGAFNPTGTREREEQPLSWLNSKSDSGAVRPNEPSSGDL